ncbi:hypothetical protein L210DRAFT_936313 [Boletus edulis BED1]|uniref:Uncharacterized protein n=1 Tax=Boletus edulis BED1 TaxID=1328754 RepID=A0AAD4BAX7_BOLED|nr:hypothetical protein L210DRAFT_936313 [Boletus edulis BED1]
MLFLTQPLAFFTNTGPDGSLTDESEDGEDILPPLIAGHKLRSLPSESLARLAQSASSIAIARSVELPDAARTKDGEYCEIPHPHTIGMPTRHRSPTTFDGGITPSVRFWKMKTPSLTPISMLCSPSHHRSMLPIPIFRLGGKLCYSTTTVHLKIYRKPLALTINYHLPQI